MLTTLQLYARLWDRWLMHAHMYNYANYLFWYKWHTETLVTMQANYIAS